MYDPGIWTITLCRPYGPSLLRVLGTADCRYRKEREMSSTAELMHTVYVIGETFDRHVRGTPRASHDDIQKQVFDISERLGSLYQILGEICAEEPLPSRAEQSARDEHHAEIRRSLNEAKSRKQNVTVDDPSSEYSAAPCAAQSLTPLGGRFTIDRNTDTDPEENEKDIAAAEALERSAKRVRDPSYKAALIATAAYLRTRAGACA